MGVEILRIDQGEGLANKYCFSCNTTDVVFGPLGYSQVVFEMVQDTFEDVRMIKETTLISLHNKFTNIANELMGSEFGKMIHNRTQPDLDDFFDDLNSYITDGHVINVSHLAWFLLHHDRGVRTSATAPLPDGMAKSPSSLLGLAHGLRNCGYWEDQAIEDGVETLGEFVYNYDMHVEPRNEDSKD